MGPCTGREREWTWDELYYICDHCRGASKRPPAYVIRIWQRAWYLCSHECYVQHLRGF